VDFRSPRLIIYPLAPPRNSSFTLKYVTSEPATRAEAVQELLDLGDIGAIRATLVRLANESLGKQDKKLVGRIKLDREIVFLVEESPEGGLEARALGMSIFTEGATLDEIRDNVRDAVRCHFEEDSQPKVVRLHFVKDEVIAV
jgi:hypothetical protein